MADVQAILSQLHKLKRAGHDKWSALCPAHEDKKPSLSICLSEDRKVLLHCHTGCSHKDILAALNLKEKDLFPSPNISNGAYQDAEDFRANHLAEKLLKGDTPTPNGIDEIDSCIYDYVDTDGKLLYQVLRKPGKGFRQRRPDGNGGWLWNLKDTPRVLYNLTDVISAPIGDWIFVVEGEKDVESLRKLGLVATTNSGGAGKWHTLANSSILHGRKIVIIPDNDEAGHNHAKQVAASLHGKAAVVKILDMMMLWAQAPIKSDISDYIKHRDCLLPEDFSGGLIELANNTKEWTPEPAEVLSTSALPVAYQPFPVEVLPEPLKSFVTQAAITIGCDSTFIALPLLAALASAIGNTRRIQLKRSWSEPAILWAAIVGDSGTMKSPAMELALKPLRDRQQKTIKRHTEAMQQYKTEAMRYDIALADWKKSGGESLPPVEPEEPMLARCWCDDTTMEALAVLLLQNWRGLLMVRDELAGWLSGFDRYAQSKGSDVAKWLEMHGGRSIMVDRKTGTPRTIYVPRAAVSVTGSIQPTTLQQALGRAYFENGLAARLLLANPPRRVKRWTESEMASDMEQAIAGVFEKLFDLEPIEGSDGEPEPGILHLSPEAKAVWIQFYNEHADEQVELSGDLSAAWSKLEGYAARLALIVHLVKWAVGDVEDSDVVDRQSIASGVEISRWFGQETRRVYDILHEDINGRQQRELIERIQRNGGTLSVRQLQRSCRVYSKSQAAEAALNTLVESGLGQWKTIPSGENGGRPTRQFTLADSADVDKTSQMLRN